MALERMNAYLRELPHGLDSYPEVQQRAAVLRVLLSGTGIERFHAQLPPELAQWALKPPEASEWLPEVRVHALSLAVADLCFMSETAVDEFIHQANLKLLDGPVYSILFRLLGPRRVCAGAARRWEQLHRNTTLTMHEYSTNACRLTVAAPEHHVPLFLARQYALAFRAALEIAGGHFVQVTPRPLAGGVVEYSAAWNH